ncbi:MAG: S41 family peptidase, partial [Bacteroidota bacterium]
KKRGIFDGDLIALVDNNTLSRTEHCALMIQAAPNGKIIGEKTQQAISNIALISLPGNFNAYFTSINHISKDGIPVQEDGIKIDIPVSYSIEGIRKGKDEILTKAIEYLETNKE